LFAARICASVLVFALLALPASAKQIWAVWELDLGTHAPPTHFVLNVTSPSGAGVPPPMTVPWKTCAIPEAPPGSYCAPIGCPPTGTYVFVVQAHYAEGVSAPSNLRCGKVVILVFGPCADVRQANGATDLGPQQAAAR
jgi:hypothetical protein